MSPARGRILLTIILIDLLTGMEFDLFVPSFPELQTQFSLSPFLLEGLLSVNFVGYAISLFFVGALADRYGRKPIILGGLVIFTIGSIFCLYLPSYGFLLSGRFLQGVGISGPSIVSFLIIADLYPLKKQQYLMAVLNGVVNASTAAAPVIGSYLTLYFHWQGNFMALLLSGLLVLGMTLCFIPNYKLPVSKENVLPRGGYLHLFQSKSLTLLIANIVCMFVPYWIFVGIAPLLYMKDLGVSLLHFGYYQAALVLVFAFGSILFGLMINKYDQKKMLYVSGYVFIGSLISLSLVTFLNSSSALLITFAFLPFIIAQIMPSAILYPLALNFMPHAKGRVSALIQGARLAFSAFFLQLAGYYYQGSFQNIGIIISGFILITVVTLWGVIRNRELMMKKKGDLLT